MIIAIIVTLLSMVSYHRRCKNHPAIPPPAVLSSCRSCCHNCDRGGEENNKAVGGGEGGEGVTVEGGSLGKRGGGDRGNSSQWGWWCGKTTPFRCPGEERQGEARGAPRQGYLCNNNQCGRTSSPSSPIAQAHIERSLGGGGTNPLVATIPTMRPGMGNAVTASALGGSSRRGASMMTARTTTTGMSWTAAAAMRPAARRAPP
jgi:hypothetical protein